MGVTDQVRFVAGALEIIYRTLEETGLVHDEGPDKDGGLGLMYRVSAMRQVFILSMRSS